MIVETADSSTRSLTPAASVLPIGVLRVDGDLHVQAVVDQHHRFGRARLAAVTDELGRVGEPDRLALHGYGEAFTVDGVRRGVGVRTGGEREVVVEEGAAAGDDLGPADGVVAGARREVALARHHVGAVQRVVERAPAGVRGVGGEPGVQQRHHQLRPSDAGDLVVHVVGGDLHVVGLVEQVADLGQERGVLLRVGPAGMRAVEVVDACLQLLAPGDQLAVARRQGVDDRVQARPERVRIDPRAREAPPRSRSGAGSRPPRAPRSGPCRPWRTSEIAHRGPGVLAHFEP